MHVFANPVTNINRMKYGKGHRDALCFQNLMKLDGQNQQDNAPE